ncbi:MAG: tRNA 5-methylaminomethyl-2-thiouridine biosynthesis bifunctional protein [Granulosicoccus sp.]|jgi:tRNA 5-methylaminomethyl-2-thiouridine biosynthesis bifunctional protein
MNKPWDTFPDLQNPLVPKQGKSDAKGIRNELCKPRNNRVAIVGAGLAGCWLARILAEQGIPVTLYEKQTSVATAASGNPAGIAKPFVTRNPSLAMSFHCIAHQHLLNRLRLFDLEASAEFTRCGVLQLVEKSYPASNYFTSLEALEAADVAGATLNSHALNFASAGWLNPKQLCCNLVIHPLITLVLGKQITSIRDSGTRLEVGHSPGTRHGHDLRSDSGKDPKADCETRFRAEYESGPEKTHRLEFQDGKSAYAEHIVLTTGSATHLIPDASDLPITAARGQISRFSLSKKSVAPKCVVNGKHYVIPDGQSLLVGASFHRDNTDTTVSEIDHAANLAGLRQLLPTLNVDPHAVAGYVGVRATTPDRLPIVGPLPDFGAAAKIYSDIQHGRPLTDYQRLPCRTGIYLIGGLGSRGIVTAPFCAQLLADHLTQASANSKAPYSSNKIVDETCTAVDYGPLEKWVTLLNPARFLIRKLKRKQKM